MDNVKGGTPGFVATEDFGEAALKNVEIERAVPVDGDRLVVDGDLGSDLRMQPDLLLRKRKRRGAAS